jgi:fermentation-respiration switch protein FrsA (DUF1100 family)
MIQHGAQATQRGKLKRAVKIMTWLMVLAGVVFAGLVALFFVFQRSLMYLPTPDLPVLEEVLPGAEAVAFETEDGLRLGGWFVPAAEVGEEGDGTSVTVLVFNGNAANRGTRVPLAERMRDIGLNVLLFDYRGYGGNPGSPSEAGLGRDARAALAYLQGRDEVDPQRIVLFGESLGSGVATELAVERAPAALVLRSPFSSMVDTARFHYPWLPVGWMLRDRYPSIERIGRLQCPLLVIAGDADAIVPAELSRKLFDAAPEPKQLIVVPDADHNDLEFSKGQVWIDDLARFLKGTGYLKNPS